MVTKEPKKAKNFATHIIKNGKIYYFCKRFGKIIKKVSLRTKNLNEAIKKVRLLQNMGIRELGEFLNNGGFKNTHLAVSYVNNRLIVEKTNENESDALVTETIKALSQ
ncbi:MAG: hypothetical protein RL154_1269, partial [Pseudomonadota bacterium]